MASELCQNGEIRFKNSHDRVSSRVFFSFKKLTIVNMEQQYKFLFLSICYRKVKTSLDYMALTPRQKSIRALEIFRVQKLILNAAS